MASIIPLVILADIEIRRSLRRRLFRPNRICALSIDEKEFISLFRVDKQIFLELCEILRPKLEPNARRENILSVELKILAALRFFAVGSYQKCLGQDFYISLCQQSISNCVRQVTCALNDLLNDYVKFPVERSEHDLLKREFYHYSGFPGVIGAIDCTHISIIRPSDDDGYHHEHNYVNRKGFHSINVQLVCDMQQTILQVCARYPGSTHDSFIWRSSSLRSWMEQNNLPNTWLVGDSGYPNEPWLLTPLEGSNLTAAQNRYNQKHVQARSVIERCNGTLKSRFRCLLKARSLHYDPTMAAKIVNACVVLHNLCTKKNFFLNKLICVE